MAVNAELYLRRSAAAAAASRLRHGVGEALPGDRPASGSESVVEGLTVVPPATPAALWRSLLPDLERDLGSELRVFRKRMLAGRVPPDFESDMFPGRRSGAWAIYREVRSVASVEGAAAPDEALAESAANTARAEASATHRQVVDGGTAPPTPQRIIEFTIYVRRGRDQLAVWQGPGTPDSLRANFSGAVPGDLMVANDVRRGFAAALVRHRIATPH